MLDCQFVGSLAIRTLMQKKRSTCPALAGADNGSLWFWDWTSGNSFQQQDTIVQPGSLDSEAGGQPQGSKNHVCEWLVLSTCSNCARDCKGSAGLISSVNGNHSDHDCHKTMLVLQASMLCRLISPALAWSPVRRTRRSRCGRRTTRPRRTATPSTSAHPRK